MDSGLDICLSNPPWQMAEAGIQPNFRATQIAVINSFWTLGAWSRALRE